mgnify:CR=1 FL=1
MLHELELEEIINLLNSKIEKLELSIKAKEEEKELEIEKSPARKTIKYFKLEEEMKKLSKDKNFYENIREIFKGNKEIQVSRLDGKRVISILDKYEDKIEKFKDLEKNFFKNSSFKFSFVKRFEEINLQFVIDKEK